MDLKALADHLNVTERTASNWRERGAPIHDVGQMVEWLSKQRRHTKISTKAIMNRRDAVATRCSAFLEAYVYLADTLSAPLQSDWECAIAVNLRLVDGQMENLAMLINPELAVDPADKKHADRLRSEAWSVTGAKSEAKRA